MIYGKLKKEVEKRANGTFANVSWQKELKTLKGVNAKVEKFSDVVARFGVAYDNIGNVKTKRENGILPSENQGLPWGTWVKGSKHFIEHKGSKYLRISLVPNNYVKSSYYVDGLEVSKEYAEKLCLASEFKKSDSTLEILTIKTENIMNIK